MNADALLAFLSTVPGRLCIGGDDGDGAPFVATIERDERVAFRAKGETPTHALADLARQVRDDAQRRIDKAQAIYNDAYRALDGAP